jgi:hypothetical protein
MHPTAIPAVHREYSVQVQFFPEMPDRPIRLLFLFTKRIRNILLCKKPDLCDIIAPLHQPCPCRGRMAHVMPRYDLYNNSLYYLCTCNTTRSQPGRDERAGQSPGASKKSLMIFTEQNIF